VMVSVPGTPLSDLRQPALAWTALPPGRVVVELVEVVGVVVVVVEAGALARVEGGGEPDPPPQAEHAATTVTSTAPARRLARLDPRRPMRSDLVSRSGLL
jgi:hypothetical protein